MNVRSALASGVYSLLTANTDLVEVLGPNKIFLRAAPPQTSVPYVIMEGVTVTQLYRSPRPELDATWMVTVVASVQPTAETIDTLVYNALHGKYLTFSDGWACHYPINFLSSIAESDIVQGTTYWQIGGYYRIRAVKIM